MAKSKKNVTRQAVPIVKTPKATVKNPAPTTKPRKKVMPPEKPKYRQGTKQDILITMLKRSTGATVKEMAEAVGWQRHSVHGMIHGLLRTRLGMQVASQKEQRGRVYRIAGSH